MPDEHLPDDSDQQAIRAQMRNLTVEYAQELLERDIPWGDATALNRVVEEYRHALQAALRELIRVDQ